MREAVVVGFGILGVCTALELVARGVQTTVVHAPNVLATSSTSFARLTQFETDLVDLRDLKRRSLELYLTYQARFPSVAGIHWVPTVVFGKMASLQQRGYGTVHKPADVDELWLGEEGWIDYRAFTRTAAEYLLGKGVDFRRAGVASLLRRAGSWVVRFADGGEFSASHVAICAGHGSAALVSRWVSLPAISTSRGLLADVRLPADLDHTIHALDISARPNGPSRALVRADDLDRYAGEAPETQYEAVRRHLEVAAAQPGTRSELKGAAVEQVTVGERLLVAGDRPFLHIDTTELHLSVALSHSGFTLGALIGSMTASAITLGAGAERS
jgi:glycine/D-amino acid oxidase-like deaminating enzyme